MKEIYQQTAEEVLERVESRESGLTDEQVRRSREKCGWNELAEGKKKTDIKYHIIFFMTFLFAAIGPYIPNGGEGFGAAVAFTFLLVIGIASIRKIKKNKKKADEYI